MRAKVIFSGGNDYEFNYLDDLMNWLYDQRDKNEHFCRKMRKIEISDLPRGTSFFTDKKSLNTPCGRIDVSIREDYDVDWRVDANIDGEIKRFEIRDVRDLSRILRDGANDAQISPLDGRAEEDLRDLWKNGLVRRNNYIDGVHVTLYV